MKKIIIVIVFFFYACPFAYFAMYTDFMKGSMNGYLLLIVSTSILAVICKFIMQKKLIVLGNLISFISSIYFVNSMQYLEGWDGFFKPLTAMQVLVVVSVFNVLPQYFMANQIKGKWR